MNNNIENNEKVEYNTNLNDLNNTPKPKKSYAGIIIIILLLLVVVALVCYIAYDKGYLDKFINKQETKEENKQEIKEENNEKEITDSATIKTLDDKLNILNNYGADWVSPASNLYKDITNKSMTDGEKLQTILLYLDNNNMFKKEERSKYPNLTGEQMKDIWGPSEEGDVITDMYIGEDDNLYHLIEASTVKDYYKRLFGGEPSTTKVKNTYPTYYYEQAYDIYVQVTRGGGTCGTRMGQYNYKYTEDKQYAYIYTVVGYTSCMDDYYKDIDLEEVAVKANVPEDLENYVEQDINDVVKKNMDKFNKYRVVFKKDGDNYIFEKVEEVK